MTKYWFLFVVLVISLFCSEVNAQIYLMRYRSHATDCTSLTDGKVTDICKDLDDGRTWSCVPTAGDCDTAAEWVDVAQGLKLTGTSLHPVSLSSNVGIGTHNPNSSLEIFKISSNDLLHITSTGTKDGDFLIITSSGNVGIGTNTPVAGLTVMNGNVGIGTWNPTAMLEVKSLGGNITMATASGSVGIGTTLPNSKLSVGGSAAIGLAYATVQAPTNGMLVQGNVGIGTNASSSNILTVLGNVGIGTSVGGATVTLGGGAKAQAGSPGKMVCLGLTSTSSACLGYCTISVRSGSGTCICTCF